MRRVDNRLIAEAAKFLQGGGALTAEREGGWTTSLKSNADDPIDVILGL